LYAVTAGLLAIGAWATFDQDQGKIDHEASALGGLYRDTIAYPEPLRTAMQEDLRRYARQVIDVGWPMQRRGIIPNNASPVLTDFQEHFMTFEPQSEGQKILAEETYRAFNDLTESRRARLNSIDAEMPGPLWTLVIAGAGICIAVTWFLHTESFIMHALDDSAVFSPAGSADFPDSSPRQSLSRKNQRFPRTTRARLSADHVTTKVTVPCFARNVTRSAELIAQSKAVQAESQSLRAQASLLRSESDAARRRVAKQRECAEKISQRANRNRLKAPDASPTNATSKSVSPSFPIQPSTD
jgi:hypothetical protein